MKMNTLATKTKSKVLKKVSFGLYVPDAKGRNPVRVTKKEESTTEGALYDLRMGYVRNSGVSKCDTDQMGCFGKIGFIPLKVSIINPIFEKDLLQYLKLFTYNEADDELVMKSGIAAIIERNKTYIGSRRLKSIAKLVPSSSETWSISEEGGLNYKKGQNLTIEFTGSQVRELLAKATIRYTKDNAPIKLKDVGINTDISKPENVVINKIPVLPNSMRLPSGTKLKQESHPYNNYYMEIISAANTNKPNEIRKKYQNLLVNGDKGSLKEDVFSNNKKKFLRGKMLSKVGGQIMRSVIVPDPTLSIDQVGIPRHLAKELSQRIQLTNENKDEIKEYIKNGTLTHIYHLESRKYIPITKTSNIVFKGENASSESTILEPGKVLLLRELKEDDVVLYNRQPSLHRNSILAARVKFHDDDVIKMHPALAPGFAADRQ